MAKTDPDLLKTLAAIQQTLATLAERVSALEARGDGGGPAAEPVARAAEQAAPELDDTPAAAAPATGATPDITPDLVLAISAAVAAYLGERAHVRQIRLISSHAWGQQGRVNVQASHALHR